MLIALNQRGGAECIDQYLSLYILIHHLITCVGAASLAFSQGRSTKNLRNEEFQQDKNIAEEISVLRICTEALRRLSRGITGYFCFDTIQQVLYWPGDMVGKNYQYTKNK
jgi:hypothetical protein